MTSDKSVAGIKEKCRCCGRTLRISCFPTTKSNFYKDGVSPFCRDCCNDILLEHYEKTKNIKESILLVCSKIDEMVMPSCMQWVLDQEKEPTFNDLLYDKKIFGEFLRRNNNKINCLPDKKGGTSFNNTNFCGLPFKTSEKIDEDGQIYIGRDAVEEFDEDSDPEKRITRREIREFRDKFGNFPDDDLRWLGKRYKEWEERYDISELNTQKLIVQLVCDEYSIVQKRERGIDVSKQWKTFMDTMKQLQLTPKQQAKNSTSVGFTSLGDFIKEVEKTRPIVNRDPEFEDVDGINKIKIAISGAIARTLGKDNDYSRAFEKLYKDYSSDLLQTSSDVDDYE